LQLVQYICIGIEIKNLPKVWRREAGLLKDQKRNELWPNLSKALFLIHYEFEAAEVERFAALKILISRGSFWFSAIYQVSDNP